MGPTVGCCPRDWPADSVSPTPTPVQIEFRIRQIMLDYFEFYVGALLFFVGLCSDTLFLRCANTHGPALLTFYHVTGISGGGIAQMQGHSIEPADVRAQYLADGEVRDAGAFLSFFTKVA